MTLSQNAGRKRTLSTIKRHWQLYVMLLLVVAYFGIFKYWPMYGVQIAFRQYKAKLGIWGSPWIGWKNFNRFFSSYYCGRLIRNTLKINIYSVIFSFWVPIVLALMISELRGTRFKKTLQMVTYAPHFLSVTVLVGMIQLFFATGSGMVNLARNAIGLESVAYLTEPKYFLPLYIISGIWQQSGWSSVIYIAAIAGVDYSLYEAAYLDGAGTLKRIWYVTLPCIAPTIVMLLILKLGSLMSVGFEKAYLMQNSLNIDASDIISTYVYRMGLQQADYSYSSAIDLFSSVINFVMLVSVNFVSTKLSGIGIW